MSDLPGIPFRLALLLVFCISAVTAVQFCNSLSVCSNGGTCLELVDGYYCVCAASFGGRNCTVDTSHCQSNPCKNGGRCKELVNDYTCHCPASYGGVNCDRVLNECLLTPCQHDGQCLALLKGHLCICDSGYKGLNCEVDTRTCTAVPCFHGGTCTNTMSGFNCSCPPGFTGLQCQEELHECELMPCQNGGLCLALFNGYLCQCSTYYCGKHCEQAAGLLLPSTQTTGKFLHGCLPPKGCQDQYDLGHRIDGVFSMDPDGQGSFQAWCDFFGEKGWLVFQRRLDGSVDFDRNWDDYAKGFGNLSGEYWLGNNNLHRVAGVSRALNVYIEDFKGQSREANYTSFQVAGVASKYTVQISGYSGNAGDSLTPATTNNINGMMFTTKDSDNDRSIANCATARGAWWHNSCSVAFPNGRYSSYVRWNAWQGGTSMKKIIFRLNV